jgi:hypothetical protein
VIIVVQSNDIVVVLLVVVWQVELDAFEYVVDREKEELVSKLVVILLTECDAEIDWTES